MSDPRYKGGITAGILKSHQHGEWPDEVPGLGPKMLGVFNQCLDCKDEQRFRGPDWAGHSGGWLTYGGRPICKRHAQERVRKEPPADAQLELAAP